MDGWLCSWWTKKVQNSHWCDEIISQLLNHFISNFPPPRVVKDFKYYIKAKLAFKLYRKKTTSAAIRMLYLWLNWQVQPSQPVLVFPSAGVKPEPVTLPGMPASRDHVCRPTCHFSKKLGAQLQPQCVSQSCSTAHAGFTVLHIDKSVGVIVSVLLIGCWVE